MGRRKFREFGPAEVLTAMKAVVDEVGHDFVYSKTDSGSCQYMHGEEVPGCLIGQVLIKLGAQPRVLFEAERTFMNHNGHGIGIEEFLGILAPTWGTLGYTLTEDAVRVLEEAQNAQDVYNTWGRALQVAQEAAGELETV